MAAAVMGGALLRGVNDCATDAAEHVLRLTGRDVWAPYREAYRSAAGAARLIASAGGYAELVDEALRGVWIRGGAPAELALLGEEEGALAVRDGDMWRARAVDGGRIWIRCDAVIPQATWGPARG